MNIKRLLRSENERSALVKKNIVWSFVLKGVSILISLQVVPLTIHYVNSVQYGIWLTLSSLMSWFFFFDIGLTHGFRNRFTEAKARGNIKMAKIYVSTTYFSLAILVLLMFLLVGFVNGHLNWCDILGISSEYEQELSRVFLIIVFFFGSNMVFSVFTTLLTADQKPALNSFISVLGQVLSFVALIILIHIQKTGTLQILAFLFSGIPVAVLLLSSIIFFHTKYKNVAPNIRYVRFRQIKNILGLGIKFFVIVISIMFIYQLMNVIISREMGPATVTEYNIAYKYFNVLYMSVILILNPFWSAFTDAYTQKDYKWMSNIFHKLDLLGLTIIPVLLLMYLLSTYFYEFWIGNAVTVSTDINISVMIYTLFLIIANVYHYMINGTGKVYIQLIIYLVFAPFAYPGMTYMCRYWGVSGLLVIPSLVFIFQILFCRIQLKKILQDRATGLWNK